MRRFLLWCWFVGGMAALLLQASPCTNPKRVVNGYTVNLQPLMTWWTDSKGVRPLSGWKHVRGNVSRDTTFGWVVTGKAEGHGQFKSFFLKNPPRDKLARFTALQTRLSQLEPSRAVVMEFLRRPVTSSWIWPGAGPGGTTYVSTAEHRGYEEQLRVIDQEVDAIKEELAPMQDEAGSFKVDVFALRLPESFEGTPVFDYGHPLLGTSP